MSQKIYKYQLELRPCTLLKMPRGAKVIHLNVQNDIPCIWAIVDIRPDTPLVTRRFERVITGGTVFDVPPKFNYIGTYQLQNGELVYHLFDDCSCDWDRKHEP